MNHIHERIPLEEIFQRDSIFNRYFNSCGKLSDLYFSRSLQAGQIPYNVS